MARFLGAIQGSRGEATRLGGVQSGIRAQAQGWDVGVKVYGHADGQADVFDIYMTTGSHASGSPIHIGTVRMSTGTEPRSPVFTPTYSG